MINTNQYQPKTNNPTEIKELARQQSIFYQVVLYRCLIVVQWCCECLQADRVNCRGQLRYAINLISDWVGKFNKRVTKQIASEHIEKYEDDSSFMYDVILIANTVHPDDRYGFIKRMAATVQRFHDDEKRIL